MTSNVFGGTLNPAQLAAHSTHTAAVSVSGDAARLQHLVVVPAERVQQTADRDQTSCIHVRHISCLHHGGRVPQATAAVINQRIFLPTQPCNHSQSCSSNVVLLCAVVITPPGYKAKYCDKQVCVIICVSVRPSLRTYRSISRFT